jgi:hypothetical protein
MKSEAEPDGRACEVQTLELIHRRDHAYICNVGVFGRIDNEGYSYENDSALIGYTIAEIPLPPSWLSCISKICPKSVQNLSNHCARTTRLAMHTGMRPTKMRRELPRLTPCGRVSWFQPVQVQRFSSMEVR